jgi:hypothetical protein
MKPLRFVPSALVLFPSVALAGFDPTRLVSGTIVFLILGAIIMLFSIPWLYKRGLKNQGEKSLNRFLLNDPTTRDMLLKKKGYAPVRPAEPASPADPSAPPPPDDPGKE